MNIALPAVVVFVLLLPGFIARSRLKRIERLSVDYSPFGQVATEAVVWAGGLHVLWVLLMGWLTPYAFRPEIVVLVPHWRQAIAMVAPDTDAAAALYMSCGFVEVGRVGGWRKASGGSDARA